jgi:hypothetical protein
MFLRYDGIHGFQHCLLLVSQFYSKFIISFGFRLFSSFVLSVYSNFVFLKRQYRIYYFGTVSVDNIEFIILEPVLWTRKESKPQLGRFINWVLSGLSN